MKKSNITFNYLYKVFCRSKKKISILWTFDAIGVLYESFEPWLIAMAIDGLMSKKYNCLFPLIISFLINTSFNYFNDFFDDVFYSDIRTNLKLEYYVDAKNRGLNKSVIDSNVELVVLKQ